MHPDHDSIFGDTYHGVPSPYKPHMHPYPTRFHGPIYTIPDTRGRYVETPYALAPTAGLGGSCGCPIPVDGVGALGALGEPLLCVSTGSTVVDALLGAAAGYFVAPKPDDKAVYAAAGAGIGAMTGLFGIVVASFISLTTQKK